MSKADGPLATIELPSDGSNWEGGSYDPETHTLYIFSQTRPRLLGLVPCDPKRVRHGLHPGIAAGGRGELTVRGLPLIKPPYGRITAIDMDKGEFRWQVAHGTTPDNIRNSPALKGLNIPRTGNSNSQGTIGTLVTKTLRYRRGRRNYNHASRGAWCDAASL